MSKLPDGSVCEVKFGDVWHTATLTEAQGIYGYAAKRCPACHGAVYVRGSYGLKQQLRLAHIKLHTGCPLTPKAFSGMSSLHPEALP